MKFKFKMPRYYFIKSAIEIFSILSSNRKFQIGLLFLSMLMNSISEIFLLGSVIPFISIISNPNKFLDDPFIKNYFNFSDSLEFSVILKQFLFVLREMWRCTYRLVSRLFTLLREEETERRR